MSDQQPQADSPWQRYERGFRCLLWRVKPAGLQAAVHQRLEAARAEVAAGEPPDEALAAQYRAARAAAIDRLLARAGSSTAGGRNSERSDQRRRERIGKLLEQGIARAPLEPSPDFDCDAGLGGVARWLRAAGYDAAWWPGIDDDELLRHAAGTTAILLTTDRRLAARGVITCGAVAALLVPLGPHKEGQWQFVARQLQLPRKRTRCMKCGGRLQPVEKQTVRDRIPPRTWPWLDEYFLCQRCGKLFWKGTHWQRIERGLRHL